MTLKFEGRAAPSKLGEPEAEEVEEEPTPAPWIPALAEVEPEEEGGCPKEPHLHVTANRHFGMLFPLFDVGGQIVSGKGPWTLNAHCPMCGKLVEDQERRTYRCDGQGCDGKWKVPDNQFRAARDAARNSPEGEEFVMLVRADDET